MPRRLSEREYFAREHVIVSYNADLRGVIEDAFHKQRRVRCALSSFSHLGSVVKDSQLVATVPAAIAQHLCSLHPQLATAELPFDLHDNAIELLWPQVTDDDPACKFMREQVRHVAARLQAEAPRSRRRRTSSAAPRGTISTSSTRTTAK